MVGSLEYPTGTESTVGQQRSPIQIVDRFDFILTTLNNLIGVGEYSFPDAAYAGTTNKALISDGDGTTSWNHVLRSNVSLEHDAGAGTSGQFLKSDGDGTTSWVTSTPVTDGDKGDIVVSSSTTVWTVDTGAIDAGKLASNAVTVGKINNGEITVAKLAASAITGTGTKVATATGTLTSGNIASWDANGNVIASGTAVTGIPSIIRAYKSANQSITTTTYTDSTSLSLVLSANKNYKLGWDLSVTNGTSVGFHIKVCLSDTVTNFNFNQHITQSYPKEDGTTIFQATGTNVDTTTNDFNPYASTTAVASTDFFINGFAIIASSGTDRTFKVMFKQQTAASSLTMNKGSIFYAIEL